MNGSVCFWQPGLGTRFLRPFELGVRSCNNLQRESFWDQAEKRTTWYFEKRSLKRWDMPKGDLSSTQTMAFFQCFCWVVKHDPTLELRQDPTKPAVVLVCFLGGLRDGFDRMTPAGCRIFPKNVAIANDDRWFSCWMCCFSRMYPVFNFSCELPVEKLGNSVIFRYFSEHMH